MTTSASSLSNLSDQELLIEAKRLAHHERQATARLIASLAELDARRLYLAEGCSSLFTYCTQILHLSEHAAYGRIEAARAARRFPLFLELLAEGAVTLTAVSLLSPHLTPENHYSILEAARHKSKRDVEHIVAGLLPRPAVPATIRKLPEPKACAMPLAPTPAGDQHDAAPSLSAIVFPQPPKRPAEVRPLAPERYRVQFTVDRETYDKLRQVQDLLRHQVPNGDPAAIFDRALTVLLDKRSRTKVATTDRPGAERATATGSRHVPAAIKRAVWTRDGGRCAFVGASGRCTETGFLEFHHVVPFAAGGETTSDNVELRCRPHNVYEAEQYFGPPLTREDRCTHG